MCKWPEKSKKYIDISEKLEMAPKYKNRMIKK